MEAGLQEIRGALVKKGDLNGYWIQTNHTVESCGSIWKAVATERTLIEQTSTESERFGPPNAEEVRTELQTILNSAAFRRAERHSQFLRFVCEMTLSGDSAKLNEYVVAHDVFGRGADYSPGEDSVVRRQAHSLRQKLHDYYAGEGSANRIRIELPVGRYVPVFVRTDRKPPELAEIVKLNAQESPLSAGFHRWRQPGLIASGLALLALGWFIGGLAHQSRTIAAVDPAVAEIWKPWLSDPEGAVICFSNPMTAVVKQFSFSLPPDSKSEPPRILVTPEQADEFRSYFGLPVGGHFYLYPAISQSKTGEALGGVTLTSLLTRAGVSVRATQSRFLSWETFRNQNLILLGHDEANRWLDPLLNKLPIRMATTDGDKARRIIDTLPDPGKPLEFYLEQRRGPGRVSRDYALVSMIGGIDDRHRLLLINGLNTEGTQIAMEYLCDPRALRELISRLRRAAPDHKGNWRFQLVLRTEVRDQVPTRADLLVVKVL